jgi:hypothetical protein
VPANSNHQPPTTNHQPALSAQIPFLPCLFVLYYNRALFTFFSININFICICHPSLRAACPVHTIFTGGTTDDIWEAAKIVQMVLLSSS